MLLNKELNLGSEIEKVITGKFFPNNKSDHNDILLLKGGEICVYNGEYTFKDGLSNSAEHLSTLNACDEAFLTFKLDCHCINLWKYSLFDSNIEFIIFLDSSYRLFLLSVKKIYVPHSNNCLDCNSENTNNQVNIDDIFFCEKLAVQVESAISIHEAHYCNLNINGNNSENISINNNNIIFSFDYFTGFIVMSLNTSNIIFISPKITLLREGHIENIELKLCSQNLIYINQSEYRLSNLTLIGNELKKGTLLFVLLQRIDTLTPHFQIIIPDWDNTLANSKTLGDNSSCFSVQDNNNKPVMKSIKFELKNPNLVTGESEFSLNTQHIALNNKVSQSCNKNLQVFHMNACMQIHKNNSAEKIGCKGHFSNKIFILIFDCFSSQIIIIFGNLFPRTGGINENDFKSRLYESIYASKRGKLGEGLEYEFEREFGCEYDKGGTEVKYVPINMNLSYGNRVLLVDYFYESNSELLKSLLIFDNAIVLELIVYFKNNKIENTEVRTIYSIETEHGFSDITEINKCSINSYKFNTEYLILSSVGCIKRIKLPELHIEDISISNKNELVDLKDSMVIDENRIALLVKKKMLNKVKFNDNKREWKEHTFLKIFEINSIRIEYLYNFNSRKQGVTNILPFSESENAFLLFYIKPIGNCEIDLITKFSCKNGIKYSINKLTDSNTFGDESDNFIFSMLITIDILSIGNNRYLNITNKGIMLLEVKFSTEKGDENNGYAVNNVPSVVSRYIWKVNDSFDEIMFVSAVDESALMLITQEMRIIKFEINLENKIDTTNVTDVGFIKIITSFDSKYILVNSELGILSLIGSSENNVYCLFISDEEGKCKIKELKLGKEQNDCLVTSVKLGKKNDDNVYLINNLGKVYIYDINEILTFILEDLPIVAKKITSIDDFFNLNCASKQLDWKILSQETDHIETCRIKRIRIIIGSTPYNIFMEVLEYLDDIFHVNMRKISVPEFSIYSPINKKTNSFGFLINGNTKTLHLINLNKYKSNKYEKEIEINYELEEFEKMIYLKESKIIILNTITKNVLGFENNVKTEYISKMGLFNTNCDLIGEINYYSNSELKDNLPYKIFPFDNKSVFFQTVINRYKNTFFTRVNLLFILDHNKNPGNSGDIIIKYGDCVLNYLRVDFILKHPKNPNIFVFISKVLSEKKFNRDTNSNKFLVSLYKLEMRNNSGKNGERLVFSNELVLVKISDIEIMDIKSVNSVEFTEDLELSNDNNQAKFRMEMIKGNNLHSNYSIIYVELYINRNDEEYYTLSERKSTDLYYLGFNNFKKNIEKKSSIFMRKNKGLMFCLPLKIENESKLFIYGISIITNYLYRKNIDISLIPSNVSSLLFKLFDIIIRNSKQSNKDYLCNKKTRDNEENKYEFGKFNKTRKRQSFLTKSIKKEETDLLNQPKISLLEKNIGKLVNYDSSEVMRNIDHFQINDCFISLYINSCNKCFKWRLFMVVVMWWNIIYFSKNNRKIDNNINNDNQLRKLICPLIPNWFLEIPDAEPNTHNNLSGKSYIHSNMFKEDVVKGFYAAAIMTGDLLLDIGFNCKYR
ncbi:hypothetical protein FG386_000931 [Cryptosporidium ryanae]|uniref:uncharacterized protein n=1 Tax=Cryptosporidium ryanae TaxID=515981 RepID=UPI003519E148|nr:hypothetical protein FG386_000931 [Cryptosporidium ryanae]